MMHGYMKVNYNTRSVNIIVLLHHVLCATSACLLLVSQIQIY